MFGSAALAISVIGILGSSIGARQSRQEPDTIAALLTEVRGLRTAIEQLAATGPRVQLAMGRLQMQEQRIDALGKRHIEVRDRREETEGELARLKQMIASNENTVRTSTTPTARAQAEAEGEMARNMLGDLTAKLQRLQAEEAAIAQDVSVEQAQWTEISRRLDELDRLLNRR
jgi:chromosome segregation ATPase